MTIIISALLVAFSSAAIAVPAIAQEDGSKAANPLELAADAPESHVVVPGDTLWGISAKFVKDPRRWPDLWRLNEEQIKNPHRIYPGQVLTLKRGETPHLEVASVRVSPKQIDTPLTQAIPAIPQKVIEPFLLRPLIIEAGALDASPRIIATEDNRLFVGDNSKVYVTGIKNAKAGQTFHIYRPGKALTDSGTQEVLGHEAIYLGSARIERASDPAILQIGSALAEIGRGDRLVPAPKADVVSYVPHPPKRAVDGSIIDMPGAQSHGGPHSVITLSRGSKDGLEVGHVLAVHRAGIEVTDSFKDNKTVYKLPDERYGLVFVFRVFERVSYALVMEAKRPVLVGDAVRTP